jgi:SAM-dependent methyltransferase
LIGYQALTACYQAFLDVIVAACPGGSYLDLPCNTGWFPVAASMRGMTPSVGIDVEDYGPAMFYLNTFTGATARFVRSRWESQQRQFHPAIEGRFDVVSCMAFLVHLPDPLQFLAALADLSDHAVFLWAAFLRSDERLIRYGLADQFFGEPFPWCYDAGTAISDALLVEAMQRLGFPNWTEVTTRPGVWPAEWDNALMKPFQPMRAFLFTRS